MKIKKIKRLDLKLKYFNYQNFNIMLHNPSKFKT